MGRPARDVPPPLFEACRLWLKKSASGHSYLVGRLGGVRVLVMARRDGDGEPADTHTHVLLFGRADKTRPGAQPEPAAAQAQTASRPYASPRPMNGSHAKRSQIPDDPVPF